MSNHIVRTRLFFAQKVKQLLNWGVLDFPLGLSLWSHKMNPIDPAQSSTAMAWHKNLK